MFWPTIAIAAIALCLILYYRHRVWSRRVQNALKSPGWEKRAEEFVKSEEDQ